uniref:F-box domain-containing protein n=1 Tax=Oryza glumipatula TaxID=40148 RepID=A0A0E0AX02_9ORYZ
MSEQEGILCIGHIPSDAVVEILVRLPPSSRRRCRLVCRHWRDLVDDRTPEMRSRAKALVLVHAVAHVFDDLPEGRRRQLLPNCRGVDIVGTCNGLVFLCEWSRGFALVNPFTGERLDGAGVPPPPCPRGEEPPFYQPTHAAYAFGYHPTTGRYKIVHFPIQDRRTETFDAVRVLTLGAEEDASTSWRDVPMPAGGSSRRGSCGVVSVDGSTYWITRDTERVMSLDLGDDERVAAVTPLLPARTAGPGCTCKLTDVRGRLGVAVSVSMATSTDTDVWVLEGGGGGGGEGRWSRRYSVRVHGVEQQLAWPHFAHGEHVLTTSTHCSIRGFLYAHRLSDDGRRRLQCSVVRINERRSGKVVGSFGACYRRDLRTFAYVETTEPVSVASRRFRLVCRQWRDAIDERRAGRRRSAAPRRSSSLMMIGIYLFDDLTRGISREVLHDCQNSRTQASPSAPRLEASSVLGNPVTGETRRWTSRRRLAPLRVSTLDSEGSQQVQLRLIGYLPAASTGRYKIVHFPVKGVRRGAGFHVGG